MVSTVHREVIDALAELRRTVATLRTPVEVDLSLLAALTRLARDFETATGLKVNRSLPEAIPSLPEAQRLAFYRAAPEAGSYPPVPEVTIGVTVVLGAGLSALYDCVETR
ncbi:MAG TPA: hypothetical protein VGD99_01725 [Anaerolineae bacterium]|jgi:signal transduction histidine kinase